MSDKRQKNQLVLAFTEEGRSEAAKASQEGTESRTAKCETERPASQSEQRKSGNRRQESRRALGLPAAALAQDAGTTVERDLQATTGKASRNPEAGRRGAKAWHPNGAGSIYPASGDVGSTTQMGPDLLRTQPRVPAETLGASSGSQGTAVHRCRPSLGGGPRSGEIL
jgi:hypothetical protein